MHCTFLIMNVSRITSDCGDLALPHHKKRPRSPRVAHALCPPATSKTARITRFAIAQVVFISYSSADSQDLYQSLTALLNFMGCKVRGS